MTNDFAAHANANSKHILIKFDYLLSLLLLQSATRWKIILFACSKSQLCDCRWNLNSKVRDENVNNNLIRSILAWRREERRNSYVRKSSRHYYCDAGFHSPIQFHSSTSTHWKRFTPSHSSLIIESNPIINHHNKLNVSEWRRKKLCAQRRAKKLFHYYFRVLVLCNNNINHYCTWNRIEEDEGLDSVPLNGTQTGNATNEQQLFGEQLPSLYRGEAMKIGSK